jgi:hypothetical protein
MHFKKVFTWAMVVGLGAALGLAVMGRHEATPRVH